MGPAHWEPKAISSFALPGVKKHRLFEDSARGNSALDRQGKRTTDGPGPDSSPVGGGMVHFSIFVVAGFYSHVCLLENKISGQPQQSPRGGVMEQTNWAV